MSRACLPTQSLIISCITAASFQVLSKQLSEICKTLRYKSKHSGVAESGEGGTSEVAAQQMRALEVYNILALTLNTNYFLPPTKIMENLDITTKAATQIAH